MKLFPVILLFFFTHLAVGQNLGLIDSLSNQVSSKTGEVQFDILNNIAWEYRFVNQDSTIAFAKRAYELGKKLGLNKRLAKPLNFIGVAHEYKGEAIEAYDFYKQALVLATSQQDQSEIAYAKNNMGRLFFGQGNISRSLENYMAALEIFQSLKDSSGIAYVYLNLAQLYQSEKNFEKAEEYFLKVYDIRLSLSGIPSISALLQLGLFYRDFGMIDRSNKYFLQADSLCEMRSDEVSRAEVSIMMAENYLKEKKLKEAGSFAKRGFNYAMRKRLTKDLSAANLIMGKIAFEKNDLANASVYFKEVANSRSIRDISLKMQAHYYLGQIYSKSGQVEQELKNQNQYLQLKDSVVAQDLAKQMDRLKFQFQLEIEQKQRENELLKTIELSNNTIIKKQRFINAVYAAALVIIAIIAFLLFRSVRMKQRHNIELAKKQEEILQQSEELKASNEIIAKINESLEDLVHERTKTIKEQNQVLMQYAYFNAHQIRGPLARILGLITVLDLEFSRESFGPYMSMLHQAGTDLDSAIKQINEILDSKEV